MEKLISNITPPSSILRLNENEETDPDSLLLNGLPDTLDVSSSHEVSNDGIIADKEVLKKTVLHFAKLATEYGSNIPPAYGIKETLYNALKLLTGKEPNPENTRAINRYLDGLKGRSVDEHNLKEMMSIWSHPKPNHPTKPPFPPHPTDEDHPGSEGHPKPDYPIFN